MSYRVYLVDDDRFLLDLYAVKFKNAGHEVTAFTDGEALLAALRKGGTAPDAILIDVIMPGAGGFDILGTIRKERLVPATKIMILSNQGQDADLEKARALKADGYIIKASTIPSEVLAETIHMLERDPRAPSP